jgi:formylglycine-generating enzyme required for sulfatase activity
VTEWLDIPAKTVRLECGQRIDTRPFRIAQRPVTLGEFRRFCADAGYSTTAHRLGAKETYDRNEMLDKVSKMPPATRRRFGLHENGDLAAAAVKHVSHDDAIAYCRATGVRLPTEAEWLAAAVLNWDERFRDWSEAFKRYRSHPLAIRWAMGGEWTADTLSATEASASPVPRREHFNPDVMKVAGYTGTARRWAVVRTGPVYMLPGNWEQSPLGALAPVDFSHMLIGFRVCSLAAP